MINTRAIYSRSALSTAQKVLRDFNRTTIKKAEHKTQLENVRKMMYEYFYPINRWLFDPIYFSEFDRYKVNIETGKPKKELDCNLYYLLVRLNSIINDILRDIEAGEVDSEP